jgi:hypothetical protein
MIPPFFPQRTEIAELRQECTELRQANLSLERQVRDGIIAAVCITFPPSLTAQPGTTMLTHVSRTANA